VKRAELAVVDRRAPRLRRRRIGDRDSFWTESASEAAPLYGERTLHRDGATYRSFEAGRSKLAAALVKGWTGPLPSPGESWLYLGAAGGTTASHVADLVGPAGRVFAIEKSVRPFVRLLHVAERYPNLLPILGDVRRADDYEGLVPPVDGIYCDLAQPDQAALLLGHVRTFLREGGAVLLALKTASMGRERTPEEHREDATALLRPTLELRAPVGLEPFHRRHFLLGGTFRASRGPEARTGGARRAPPLSSPRRDPAGIPRFRPRPRPR
jgi:fibrillarin-like pre-rRNA processing protein